MREDDEIQHYAPLLRRIIVVIAVVTAVPVMMWTATAFMHRYVMRPDMPWLRSTAAQPSDAAVIIATATAPAADPNVTQAAPKIVEASAVTPDVRAADADGTSTRGVQIASATPAATPAAAQAADASSAPASTAAAPAAAPTPAATYAVASAASGPDPVSSAATSQSPPVQIAVATIASDDVTGSLPTADPLAGPVPLPRHRPVVFALVETGAVPMPRARPADATEPVPSAYSYPTGYDPAMGRY